MGAVVAGALNRVREFELRVVVAPWQPDVRHGGTTTADRSIGPRDPHAIHLDSALDRSNAKGNLVLELAALRLQHVERLSLLALVDLGVLADLVLVIFQLAESHKDGGNLEWSAKPEGRDQGR